jgi:hypothetical protein
MERMATQQNIEVSFDEVTGEFMITGQLKKDKNGFWTTCGNLRTGQFGKDHEKAGQSWTSGTVYSVGDTSLNISLVIKDKLKPFMGEQKPTHQSDIS